MTRPGQDELNDETVRQLDAPDKEAQPATPRAPSSGMMSLSPPPGVLARSFLRYSLPPCMPGPLPERIHLPSDLLIPPELLQHPLPPAIPALNATLLPFVNTAPAGMVPAVQPQLQLPPSQLALMFLDNHDTTKAASGYNKEIWFWAPSKNLDIEQLLGGHEVSIEELSTVSQLRRCGFCCWLIPSSFFLSTSHGRLS